MIAFNSGLLNPINSLNVFTIFLVLQACNPSTGKLKAPTAKKIPVELSMHGDTRIDNYYWLKDRGNPEVITYLESENAYTKEYLKPSDKFREDLYSEIIGRIEQTDLSVPYRFNGYFYYTLYETEKEYPVYCRKKGSLTADEEILLNINEMAGSHEFYDIGDWSVSPDNKMIAFTSDTVSRRQYSVYIRNLETGQLVDDQLCNTSESIVWANDNKTIFYVVKDETLRPYKIFRHSIGDDKSRDVMVYHETDSTYGTYISKTKSKKYLVISSFSILADEYRILNADTPEGEFQVFNPREKDLQYEIDHYNDVFYILTNHKAKNFRLMKTPVAKTNKENWIEVIPHSDSVFLAEFELFDDYIVLNEKINGLDNIMIIAMNSGKEHFINFDEPTYSLNFSDNPEFGTEVLRFTYSSLTTPQTVYDYDMATREKTLLKQQVVKGNFRTEDYITELLYAPVGDGAKVPLSLVYKKGMKKDGLNPLWINGYGSYGYNSDPVFRSERLSLLDRGFIFAIAHVRGGQELGRKWYDDGKLLNKKNTFTDFIACTEYLINEKYTNPKVCFAWGGSAGGLLMGAVANMRPDLYQGIIAAVPFVDVVTTMLDESIPLTTSEYDEWGNPNDVKYYNYMLSYSPYDNVKPQDYPAILVTTGLHDSQVQYWEPAKWVSKLRELKTDDQPVLLYIEMDYGHGGASGRFEKYREISLEYVFVFNLLGINN